MPFLLSALRAALLRRELTVFDCPTGIENLTLPSVARLTLAAAAVVPPARREQPLVLQASSVPEQEPGVFVGEPLQRIGNGSSPPPEGRHEEPEQPWLDPPRSFSSETVPKSTISGGGGGASTVTVIVATFERTPVSGSYDAYRTCSTPSCPAGCALNVVPTTPPCAGCSTISIVPRSQLIGSATLPRRITLTAPSAHTGGLPTTTRANASAESSPPSLARKPTVCTPAVTPALIFMPVPLSSPSPLVTRSVTGSPSGSAQRSASSTVSPGRAEASASVHTGGRLRHPAGAWCAGTARCRT